MHHRNENGIVRDYSSYTGTPEAQNLTGTTTEEPIIVTLTELENTGIIRKGATQEAVKFLEDNHNHVASMQNIKKLVSAIFEPQNTLNSTEDKSLAPNNMPEEVKEQDDSWTQKSTAKRDKDIGFGRG